LLGKDAHLQRAGNRGVPLGPLRRGRGTFTTPHAFPRRSNYGCAMRSLLLWLIGIPIPIIILLWLVTGHA
jgi:hypothetical protein